MKLEHFTEAQDPTASISKNPREEIDDPVGFRQDLIRKKKETGEFVGSGNEAVVFQRKGEQHQGTVTKIHQGRATAIKFLISANTGVYVGNPFLPKLYKVVQVRQQLFKLTVEKLKPLAVIGKEMVEPLLVSLIGSYDGFEKVRKVIPEWDEQGIEDLMERSSGASAFLVLFENLITKLADGHDILKDLSPKFQQALGLIQMYDGGDFGDIHGDNLMIRRTSTGLQLVFSDPIFTGVFLGQVDD